MRVRSLRMRMAMRIPIRKSQISQFLIVKCPPQMTANLLTNESYSSPLLCIFQVLFMHVFHEFNKYLAS